MNNTVLIFAVGVGFMAINLWANWVHGPGEVAPQVARRLRKRKVAIFLSSLVLVILNGWLANRQQDEATALTNRLLAATAHINSITTEANTVVKHIDTATAQIDTSTHNIIDATGRIEDLAKDEAKTLVNAGNRIDQSSQKLETINNQVTDSCKALGQLRDNVKVSTDKLVDVQRRTDEAIRVLVDVSDDELTNSYNTQNDRLIFALFEFVEANVHEYAVQCEEIAKKLRGNDDHAYVLAQEKQAVDALDLVMKSASADFKKLHIDFPWPSGFAEFAQDTQNSHRKVTNVDEELRRMYLMAFEVEHSIKFFRFVWQRYTTQLELGRLDHRHPNAIKQSLLSDEWVRTKFPKLINDLHIIPDPPTSQPTATSAPIITILPAGTGTR